ncbi:MAG TPA: PIN domain-containing protein [Azospirillaceae bacterium]|nr:PIN domain-containing protein [Azospirillaceae bacterium]HRQ80109.1 PIN domain-containing protein [Azospirillaceae bacterium]
MPKAVALDANLLVLLMVGLTKPGYIRVHKRLEGYSFDDFRRLGVILNQFENIVVTPNVLTETSNLLRQIAEPARSEITTVYANHIPTLVEQHISSREAAARPEFLWLGLSDAALLDVNKTDIIMLTADGKLWTAALTAGYQAWNFNHIREAAWSAASLHH